MEANFKVVGSFESDIEDLEEVTGDMAGNLIEQYLEGMSFPKVKVDVKITECKVVEKEEYWDGWVLYEVNGVVEMDLSVDDVIRQLGKDDVVSMLERYLVAWALE